MGKLNVKYDKNSNSFIVTNRIKYPEVVNQKIYNSINAGLYDGFLKLNLEKFKENRKAVLVCCASQLTQLSSYLNNQLGRDEFLDIVIQIIDRIKTCENNLLNINNIELDLGSMFIDANSQTIYTIYWPLVNNQSYIPVGSFFNNLLGNVDFYSNEKTSFLVDYKNFFETLDPFSLSSFEKLIYGFRGKKTKKISISPDSTVLNHEDVDLLSSNSKKDLTYDPFDNVRTYTDLTGANNNVKDVYSKKESVVNKSLFLLRRSNNESKEVVGTNVVLGKDPKSCSFVINGNNAISRVHATIKLVNNVYYIKDNNSTNHTYINGNKLNPKNQYVLHDRDIIKFANEEFVCLITDKKGSN